MLIFIILLLTLFAGLYFAFRARAQWKKRTVDELVFALRSLHENGRYAEYDEIYSQLRDFCRSHCTDAPMFNVEEHGCRAIQLALGLRESRAEPLINVPRRVRRTGAHKV